jgi:hypothetical protein
MVLNRSTAPAPSGQRPARPPRDADFYQSGAFSARRDRPDEHTYWPFEEGSRGSRPRSWDQARPAGERRYPRKTRQGLDDRQQVNLLRLVNEPRAAAARPRAGVGDASVARIATRRWSNVEAQAATPDAKFDGAATSPARALVEEVLGFIQRPAHASRRASPSRRRGGGLPPHRRVATARPGRNA